MALPSSAVSLRAGRATGKDGEFEGPLRKHPAPEDLVPAALLRELEERYWRPIQEVATLEALLSDTAFTGDPGAHLALYSDHGIVHVRDVAARACSLAGIANGVLMERRTPDRLRFVRGCAVLLTYLHDIGMSPANTAGRRLHAQFASQTALHHEFDGLARQLWDTDAGLLRSGIEALHRASPLQVPGPLVLREVLALTMCHSKSAVPPELLDDPQRLRSLVQFAVFTRLDAQLTPSPGPAPAGPAEARYHEVDRDAAEHSFAWLTDPHPVAAEFRADVIDAVRVLRAADALRQRGTTHRTSAGFEICTSRITGEAVCTMRTEDRQTVVVLRTSHPKCCSEANLRAVELTDVGNLRVALHRSDFLSPDVARRHAGQLADTIVDIERDALASFPAFRTSAGSPGALEIVRPHDNPGFAELLVGELMLADPSLSGRVVVVDEPGNPPPPDLVDWSVRGTLLSNDDDFAAEVISAMRSRGLHPSVDARSAFQRVRTVRILAGEQVMAAGTEATAVLVATGPGFVVRPVGGYPADLLVPWTPLGATGPVRGAERNADVWAKETVDVLSIPIDVYLAEWFRPYDLAELRAAAQTWQS